MGFEKDEGQGDAWLEKASDIKYNHNWRSAIKDLSWFDLSDYFIPLATINSFRFLYLSPKHNIIREYRLTSYKPNNRNYW